MRNFDLMMKRKSVREYKNKSLEQKDINKVRDIIKKFDDEKIKLELYLDGDEKFNKLNGYIGYLGKMIYAPHYIAIWTKETDFSKIYSGYVGEKITYKLLEEEISSCWLDIFKKEKVNEYFGEKKYNIIAFISIGYSKEEGFLKKILSTMKEDFKEKPAVMDDSFNPEDYFYIDSLEKSASYEELENRGLLELFNYMKYAPSHENKKPWKFILSKDEIIIVMEKTDKLLEGGIALYYLETILTSLGYKGQWQKDTKDLDEKNIIIGRYTVS